MILQNRKRLWACLCGTGEGSKPCRMPPAPEVMSSLFLEYKRNAINKETFAEYLGRIGFTDPSVEVNGMDDRVQAERAVSGDDSLQLISVPSFRVQGPVRIVVLLVDFPDLKGSLEVGHYEDLFFSENQHPTGSVRDYFAEVSNGLVDINGTVHGWLTMPNNYADYVGADSGMGRDYPNNCAKLAEDAAQAALDAGILFPRELDVLKRGFVTGFVLVHAGRPAEVLQSNTERKKEIWSHKWNLGKAVKVGSGLDVTTYLTVAQSCSLGVCAHELGHLLFQWQDFYDPNEKADGFWQGSGNWDLMASGSYNFGAAKPAHPAALHKMQHDWVKQMVVTQSTQGVKLLPTTANGGRVCKIVSPAFAEKQFLLLESRPKKGFDKYLPGEGLLVWRVDLAKEMFAPATPGMQLVQADGDRALESPDERAQGDDSDPFPGSRSVKEVRDTSVEPTTSFVGRRSGVTLSNISFDSSGVVTFDVTIATSPIAGKGASRTARHSDESLRSRRIFKEKPQVPLLVLDKDVGSATSASKGKSKVGAVAKVTSKRTPAAKMDEKNSPEKKAIPKVAASPKMLAKETSQKREVR